MLHSEGERNREFTCFFALHFAAKVFSRRIECIFLQREQKIYKRSPSRLETAVEMNLNLLPNLLPRGSPTLLGAPCYGEVRRRTFRLADK